MRLTSRTIAAQLGFIARSNQWNSAQAAVLQTEQRSCSGVTQEQDPSQACSSTHPHTRHLPTTLTFDIRNLCGLAGQALLAVLRYALPATSAIVRV